MKKFREFIDLKKDKQQTLAATNGQGTSTTTPATPAPAPAPAPATGTTTGPTMLPTPTASNQYRFRRFHGVNMGSWFVNEEWICASVFANAASPKQSDLDICKGTNAKANLEKHWDSWITTSDWEFIVNQGMNTIRLPIGYYHCSQASLIAGTDFAAYGSVFSGAWQRVLNAISTAKSYGLGVLVDLHAAPGAQNTQAHSGTSTGKANLWGNATNLARTLSTLQFLVQNLHNIDNVVGVELLNEPKNGDYLAGFYVQTIQALRKISSDFPLYIHDGFDPQYYAKFVGSRTDLGYIVQDTHYYRCFNSSDTNQSSDAIIQDVQNTTTGFWKNIASLSKGHIICGEWSAALAPNSLEQSSRSENSSRGFFAFTQLAMFKADIAGGWMFWTLHKESGTDTGWSLENARAANTVPPDFSNYFALPPSTNGATNGQTSSPTPTAEAMAQNKMATMRTALQSFQKKLAESNVGYEYPAMEVKPTDPNAPIPASKATPAPVQDTSDAQSELFRQGFEQGYEDARVFSLGLADLKSVIVPASADGKVPATTKTVGGFAIGHLDQWKKIRTLQFHDANQPTATAAKPKEAFTITPGEVSAAISIWEKVLQLLHLRSTSSSSKKADTGAVATAVETMETKLANLWEYMDGFGEGIKAFEAGQADTPPASGSIEEWGKEFTKHKKGLAGIF